ncbi:hypothetical protein KCP76_17570 [Salmonella enterica subsp. enterica serovar Weltevreden]|nr:hypothetical protein KCP76_17570 [Salmonella enterica subsp. enterica serovar Weltevreden]
MGTPDSIKNDVVEWLGFHWSGDIRYTSRITSIKSYAASSPNKGPPTLLVYAWSRSGEYRGTLTAPGKNSPFRDRSVGIINLALFEKMRVPAVLKRQLPSARAKIQYGVAVYRCAIRCYIALNSPVTTRPVPAVHLSDVLTYRTVTLEGITHSLCVRWSSHNVRTTALTTSPFCPPRQYEFSRLNLEYTVMSAAS